jgi:hypothetical protein
MKTSDVLHHKNKLINRINKLFDRNLLNQLSINCGFIRRIRVLNASDFFFFAYLLTNEPIQYRLMAYADTYSRKEKRFVSKAFKIDSQSRQLNL